MLSNSARCSELDSQLCRVDLHHSTLPSWAVRLLPGALTVSQVSQPLIPPQHNKATPSWISPDDVDCSEGCCFFSVDHIFPSQPGLSWRYYYSLLSISRCGRRSIHTLCRWTVPYALGARGRWTWHIQPTFALCRKLSFDATTHSFSTQKN